GARVADGRATGEELQRHREQAHVVPTAGDWGMSDPVLVSRFFQQCLAVVLFGLRSFRGRRRRFRLTNRARSRRIRLRRLFVIPAAHRSFLSLKSKKPITSAAAGLWLNAFVDSPWLHHPLTVGRRMPPPRSR